MMKRQALTAIAAGLLAGGLMQPAVGGNLLANGDFQAFVGPVGAMGAIQGSNSSNWGVWLSWPRYEVVDSSTLIDPAVPPTPFPTGWGGSNFAQHSQYFAAGTGDDGDYTDQLRQGIAGNSFVVGAPVNVSLNYINTQRGRDTKIEIYGIGAGGSWSEFAPWTCSGCTLLYSATYTTPWSGEITWQTGVGSFTPIVAYPVIAVGVTQGGYATHGRGVDDVVLTQPNRPPVCTAAAASEATLWSPNHLMVPISVLGVTDPDGDTVTITVSGIKQDEPVNGLGDGDTAPDGAGLGTSTAMVRAERAGNGNGRFYHIAFTADDGKGGTCSGEVNVSVPKSQGTKGAPVDDGALFDSTAI